MTPNRIDPVFSDEAKHRKMTYRASYSTIACTAFLAMTSASTAGAFVPASQTSPSRSRTVAFMGSSSDGEGALHPKWSGGNEGTEPLVKPLDDRQTISAWPPPPPSDSMPRVQQPQHDQPVTHPPPPPAEAKEEVKAEGPGAEGEDEGGKVDGKVGGDEQKNEWHVASTTPQLLSALWFMIVQGTGMARGETMTIEFPNMEKEFTPSYLNRLTGHLDTCKDVCDDFGINTILMPYARPGDPANKIAGFTVKSYRNPDKVGEDGEYEFDPDPFWDDVTDEDFSYIQELAAEDDYEAGDLGVDESELPQIENLIPDDDDEIIQVTRQWVDKMMSDLALCPFTSGPDMSGMPMGKVFYTVDRSKTFEEMYATYWKEVVRVEQNDEKELSTTLLIAPDFCMDNIEAYENFCNTLTQPLEVLSVEDLLQLVFFHPKWTFRDGGERSGTGGAANYARRSPWPMINILRTKQVRAAQKGIPTGLVYKQNEKTLGKIGTKQLETMLRKRDWTDVKDEKVDRRELEALRVAQDLQTTGRVAQEDMSVTSDATPAANKVDKGQVEGANMLNVMLQALEKRLHGGSDGGVQRLSGPETSAAMMASDFLLERVKELEASGPSVEHEPIF